MRTAELALCFPINSYPWVHHDDLLLQYISLSKTHETMFSLRHKLLLVVLIVSSHSAVISRGIPSTNLTKPFSARPAWTENQVDVCDPTFSHRLINARDCIDLYNELPSGSSPVRYANNARWPYRSPHSLPLFMTHKTCTIKFEASGRNASSLDSVDFIPDHLREMVIWVTSHCVVADRQGGFVTRGIESTSKYLNDPSIDVDFDVGFRKLVKPFVFLQLIRTSLNSDVHDVFQPFDMVSTS